MSEIVNLNEMNTDILSKIFDEVTIQNRDEVAIFTEKYDKFIQSKGYADMDFKDAIPDCDSFEEVQDWIGDYISSLNQAQINSILCDYGINKALMRFHDWYTIGLGDTADDICEEIKMNHGEENMVQLILNDAVNFNSNWR